MKVSVIVLALVAISFDGVLGVVYQDKFVNERNDVVKVSCERSPEKKNGKPLVVSPAQLKNKQTAKITIDTNQEPTDIYCWAEPASLTGTIDPFKIYLPTVDKQGSTFTIKGDGVYEDRVRVMKFPAK